MNTAVVSAIVKPDGVFTIKPAPFIKTGTKEITFLMGWVVLKIWRKFYNKEVCKILSILW